MKHLSPSGAEHYWTVTSECPLCLREEIERLQDELERNTEHVLRFLGAQLCSTHQAEVLTLSPGEFVDRELKRGCPVCVATDRDRLRELVVAVGEGSSYGADVNGYVPVLVHQSPLAACRAEAERVGPRRVRTEDARNEGPYDVPHLDDRTEPEKGE